METKHDRIPVRHVALLTEYDGSNFNGWQAQALGRTVQQTLVKALEQLTGQTGITLYGSSRTDAGVHARGHVSHFCARTRIPAEKLPLAMNSLLPSDVAVLAAADVSEDFHAQYRAKGKLYSYKIWNHASRPAMDRLRVCHVPIKLDLEKIRQAMPLLVGRRDFSAFADTGSCPRNPVRTLSDITLDADGPRLIFRFQGDGFLYHMIRILTGTLVAIGQNKLTGQDLPAIIAAGDRTRSGKTMPPQGLCLERVYYDPPLFDDFFFQIHSK